MSSEIISSKTVRYLLKEVWYRFDLLALVRVSALVWN